MGSLSASGLVGIIVSCIIWGIYTCLFIITVSIMRLRKASLSPAFALVIVLYITKCVVSVFFIIAAYNAFVVFPGGPEVYYLLLWSKGKLAVLMTLADIELSISSLLADGLLAWRAWIIWNRDNRILILPAITSTVVFGGLIAIVVYDIRESRYPVGTPQWSLAFTGEVPFGKALFALSMIMVFYVTFMICGRLWFVRKQVIQHTSPDDGPGLYFRVILVLVESGGLYLCWTSFFLAVYCYADTTTGAFLFYVGQHVNHLIVGIVPTLIVLQLGLGHLQPDDRPDTLNMSTAGTWKFANFSRGEDQSISSRPRRRRGPRETAVTFFSGHLDPESGESDIRSHGGSGAPKFDVDDIRIPSGSQGRSIDLQADDEKEYQEV